MTGFEVASGNARSWHRLAGWRRDTCTGHWMKPCGSEAPQADAHAGVREWKVPFRVLHGLADERGRTCKVALDGRLCTFGNRVPDTGHRPHHHHHCPGIPLQHALVPFHLHDAGWRVSTHTSRLPPRHALPPSTLSIATPPWRPETRAMRAPRPIPSSARRAQSARTKRMSSLRHAQTPRDEARLAACAAHQCVCRRPTRVQQLETAAREGERITTQWLSRKFTRMETTSTKRGRKRTCTKWKRPRSPHLNQMRKATRSTTTQTRTPSSGGDCEQICAITIACWKVSRATWSLSHEYR